MYDKYELVIYHFFKFIHITLNIPKKIHLHSFIMIQVIILWLGELKN